MAAIDRLDADLDRKPRDPPAQEGTPGPVEGAAETQRKPSAA